jgi:hypothetical protein
MVINILIFYFEFSIYVKFFSNSIFLVHCQFKIFFFIFSLSSAYFHVLHFLLLSLMYSLNLFHHLTPIIPIIIMNYRFYLILHSLYTIIKHYPLYSSFLLFLLLIYCTKYYLHKILKLYYLIYHTFKFYTILL